MVNEELTTNADDKKTDKLITLATPNKQCHVSIMALPLNPEAVKLIESQKHLLKAFFTGDQAHLTAESIAAYESFKADLKSLLDQDPHEELHDCEILAFGPRKTGPNVLLSKYCGKIDQFSSIENGFQLATLSGPLCEEPLMGCAFVIQDFNIDLDMVIENDLYGPVSGQIVSIVKEGCRKAFQAHPQRLMAAMYSCDVTVKADVLGKMYAVLNKRHGKIVHENMIEGSSNFVVTAHLPVIESFNFAAEIRKQTSGLAMPQLVFSHWEVIDLDPFWIPQTAEEILHFGDKADSDNFARGYMNEIRKKKGLAIDEKIVEFAEKQRTLTRMK